MSLPFEAYVSMTASVLGLDLPAVAREQVAAHLANLRRLAAVFEAIPLDDDLEPAPVFRLKATRPS
jgi:hypothetical protein